ncbi:MAG: hypothetical protein GY861_16675 [bacterium]|nr:hypothetical protein [bacterium]
MTYCNVYSEPWYTNNNCVWDNSTGVCLKPEHRVCPFDWEEHELLFNKNTGRNKGTNPRGEGGI